MVVNIILIAVIVAGIVLFVKKYLENLETLDLEDEEEETDTVDDYTVKYFVKETANAFTKTLKQNLDEDNYSKEELIKKRQRQSALKGALTKAAYGDPYAKATVKNHIKALLVEDRYQLDENALKKIIPFQKPEKLSSSDKFEILLYYYNRMAADKSTPTNKLDGFDQMMKEYDLKAPITVNGEKRYKVTKEIISDVYEDAITNKKSEFLGSDVEITKNDMLDILAQRIFEEYIGLGPVDMLLETSVDEIDAGVSGIPVGAFTIKSEGLEVPFSYESVWVVYKGLNIQLECCSFHSQNELIRVTENIYKYDAPYVMSRSEGRVVSTMIDGSRIVAVRPPFAESYAFFLRKFDSAPSVKPEDIIRQDNAQVAILMMKWLIRGQRNIGITGSQGTGKTTMLKSMIRFIDPALNLRIQELQFELNLRFAYPDRNVITFQETANISAQEGLNLQKKTNGSVNIIGEVANAIQASHIIQTAMVASLFAMFTHHAKTAHDFVEAIANNLLEIGLYKEKKDAVAMTAKVLNIDCHLVNVKGDRHIERITEIIPLSSKAYPSASLVQSFNTQAYMESLEKSENLIEEDMERSLVKYRLAETLDSMEYFKRETDPEFFETRDIVRYFPLLDENGDQLRDKSGNPLGTFKLVNMPSDGMLEDIRRVLSIDEEKEFNADMELIKQLSDKEVRIAL